ncbi:MAG: exostosin family protein [Alphaproteobacteria bacterium]
MRDDKMPRSLYYIELINAFKQHFTLIEDDDPRQADFYIPHEDMICEWNWPHHATKDAHYKLSNSQTNYVRGHSRQVGTKQAWDANGLLVSYVYHLCQWAAKNPDKKLFILNMHPWYSLTANLRLYPNIYYARACAVTHELSMMNKIISFPAPPIQRGKGQFQAGTRKFKASFQGVNSHECRQKLTELHNDNDIIVKLFQSDRHQHIRLDAMQDQTDIKTGDYEYRSLMENSDFAFVPRGDALYSYRLLEAMSFNTIPIIISDGWLLPFHRTVPWPLFSLHVSSDRIKFIPNILNRIPPEKILAMRRHLSHWYQNSFANIGCFLKQNIEEIEAIDHYVERYDQF